MTKKQRKKLDKKAIKAILAIEKYEIELKRTRRSNQDDYVTDVNYCQFGNFTFIFTSNKDIGNSLIEQVEDKHLK